jgi:hypothetical protein
MANQPIRYQNIATQEAEDDYGSDDEQHRSNGRLPLNDQDGRRSSEPRNCADSQTTRRGGCSLTIAATAALLLLSLGGLSWWASRYHLQWSSSTPIPYSPYDGLLRVVALTQLPHLINDRVVSFTHTSQFPFHPDFNRFLYRDVGAPSVASGFSKLSESRWLNNTLVMLEQDGGPACVDSGFFAFTSGCEVYNDMSVKVDVMQLDDYEPPQSRGRAPVPAPHWLPAGSLRCPGPSASSDDAEAEAYVARLRLEEENSTRCRKGMTWSGCGLPPSGVCSARIPRGARTTQCSASKCAHSPSSLRLCRLRRLGVTASLFP